MSGNRNKRRSNKKIKSASLEKKRKGKTKERKIQQKHKDSKVELNYPHEIVWFSCFRTG